MTKDLLKRIFVKETSLYSYSTWNMISIINQKKKKKEGEGEEDDEDERVGEITEGDRAPETCY